MFFSVIVPVYKVEEYLGPCIESVLNQTFTDFELILVNDGSPDRCPEICEQYQQQDSRIKVVHKANGGLVSARQAGIRIAEGDYVFHLDSDDAIELDVLEEAHRIIGDTGCDIVSFGRKWVADGYTVKISDDDLAEGLYTGDKLEKYVYPKLLMDKDMAHIAWYITGKAIKRDFLLPFQLAVNEKISLGEDLCCTVACYLNAESIYISKKTAYLYTVRGNSMSTEFNTRQINLIENVIKEITANDTSKVADFQEQLHRYSCFMCFAILASAAEGNHFNSINRIQETILRSIHAENILRAQFESITIKSKIAISLMKKQHYTAAFYFLNLCKRIKNFLKKG